MTGLLELLESFNRKERFFLIGDALGNRTFQLSNDFRARIWPSLGHQARYVEAGCRRNRSRSKPAQDGGQPYGKTPENPQSAL